jgi:hypothetical protein
VIEPRDSFCDDDYELAISITVRNSQPLYWLKEELLTMNLIKPEESEVTSRRDWLNAF